MEILENFIGRAFESGRVCKIKCLECGSETISVSIDRDIDLECGDCDSDYVEVVYLNK